MTFLSVYNFPSESGFRILRSKLSQKGMYTYPFDCFYGDRLLKNKKAKIQSFDVRRGNSQSM